MTGIDQELQSIEEALAAIERRKAELVQRQSLLLVQQQSLIPAITQPDPISMTTQQKVDLFISLFQGRNDIYAMRWENKQGRSGYFVMKCCAAGWG